MQTEARRLLCFRFGQGGMAEADLSAFVKRSMPEYMLPSAFVCLDKLPLSPNGKVDRRALPVPDWSRRAPAVEFVAPRTPVEETLAEIWKDLLGIDRISVHASFFELGGHSLLATRAVSRIHTAFSVEVPLRSLFETPTIAELAVTITQQMIMASGDDLVSLLDELYTLTESDVS